MTQDFQLKHLIKQQIQKYNRDQKILYLNSFILKIVLCIVIFMFLMIILIFIMPLLTPFMLEAGVIGTAITLTCSGVLISLTVFIYLIYLVRKKKKQKKLDQEKYIQEKIVNDLDKDLANASVKQESFETNNKNRIVKKSFFSRMFNFFIIVKDLFLLLGKFFLEPVHKTDYIYFDKNKYDLTLWIIAESSKSSNLVVEKDRVLKQYSDVSETWVDNTLKELQKLQIVSISLSEFEQSIILLNEEFSKPTHS